MKANKKIAWVKYLEALGEVTPEDAAKLVAEQKDRKAKINERRSWRKKVLSFKPSAAPRLRGRSNLAVVIDEAGFNEG